MKKLLQIIQNLMQYKLFMFLINPSTILLATKLFKFLKKILPTILLILSIFIILSGIGNYFLGGWEAFGMLCIIIGVISIILLHKYTMIFKAKSDK
jgi:uncharacterized membrane-anchored protein